MKRAIVVVVALAACVPASRHPERQNASPAPQRPDDLARLRERAKTDIIGVLLELGVREQDFEQVARTLYNRWVAKQPKVAPPPTAATAPTTPQAPPPVQHPQATREQRRWWCSALGSYSWCDESLTECNDTRALFANAEDCERTSGLPKEDCIAVVAAQRGIGPCKHQDRAACFEKRLVVKGVDGLQCATTMAHCKEQRIKATKSKDDIKVLSSCKPTE